MTATSREPETPGEPGSAGRAGSSGGVVSPHELAAALGLPAPTAEQAAVIAAPVEPCLVTAGAGAGKTETMAARVVWLVANGHVAPERVLGLTFTRKAAGQLGERVRSRLRRLAGSGLLAGVSHPDAGHPSEGHPSEGHPGASHPDASHPDAGHPSEGHPSEGHPGASHPSASHPGASHPGAGLAGEPTVLTYHAYAGRLIGEHGLRVPVPPGARVLPATAAWQLAHRVVTSWDADLDTDLVPATITERVLGLAAELGEHLLDPDALVAESEAVVAAVENAPPAPRQAAKLPKDLAEVCERQRLRLELLPLVAEYQRRKLDAGVLDFADQMSLAARLAKEHPEVIEAERDRFAAVLLDEYQDTGHAQRVLLRALFGAPGSGEGGQAEPRAVGAAQVGAAQVGATQRGDQSLPVTAVGDGLQAIYGWRGASASNLPRFTTDFPRAGDFPRVGDGGGLTPARRYGMLTSFRNAAPVLTLANAVSAPLRASGDELTARPEAGEADVACALLGDVQAEREWLADELSRRWFAGAEGEHPTAAVLVRRRADMAPIAAALRERGLPVEVVGLGGLLDEPEVADLVAMLRVLADPLAGAATARLLTGARVRLGAADLAALARRARELGSDGAGGSGAGASGAGGGGPEADALLPERSEEAGLIDAVDDPGEPGRYSAEGLRRIRAFARELAGLRERLDVPLEELIAEVERTVLLGVEVCSRPDGVGRAHLDAFAGVVAEFTDGAVTPSLSAFVDYLSAAEDVEDGFEPGEVTVSSSAVQILTVHAAKGLEWRLVAIPHLVAGRFPARRQSSSWLRTPTELPAKLRGDVADLPELDLAGCADRKEVEEELGRHERLFAERRADEERRLCYVAVTRAEHGLLVSGHRWNETGAKPREPSPFLTEMAEVIERHGPGVGAIAEWAKAPEDGAPNPLVVSAREAMWPSDPLGARREAVEHGAGLVRAELAALGAQPDGGAPDGGDPASAEPAGEGRKGDEPAGLDPESAGPAGGDPASGDSASENPAGERPDGQDPDGWVADTDALLAERERARHPDTRVLLPEQLSVSRLVELSADPDGLAARLRRPLPAPPDTVARRGTSFHAWLERRFAGGRLFDFDELPGAADTDAEADAEFDELRAAFEASAWAHRTPHEVEVPFACDVDGVSLRGRIDAVFADADGGWTVVDWKTGVPPPESAMRAVTVQLAVYRLAWASLAGVAPERVRAAFHYVRSGRTVAPADLLEVEGLRALLRSVPQE